MQLIDLTDSELEDDSFTISYEVKQKKAWISFHDYIADFSFLLRNQTLISFKDSAIWKHEGGKVGSFFDGIHKSYLTPVYRIESQSRIINFILNFIKYKVDFYVEKRLLQKTIDTISFHNSYQSTREIVLVPKHECQGYGANTARLSSYWSFNKIKDETDNNLKITLYEKFDEYVVNTIQNDCLKRKRYFVDDYVIAKLTTNNTDGSIMYFSDIDFNVTPIIV